MANTDLYQQFIKAFEACRSYQYLSEEERIATKESFKTVSQEELQQALELFHEDTDLHENLDQDILKKRQEISVELKADIHAAKRAEIAHDENIEREGTDEKADKLIEDLDSL